MRRNIFGKADDSKTDDSSYNCVMLTFVLACLLGLMIGARIWP